MIKLRFRQVHLDFHTSPMIENIGAAFDKAEYQRLLRLARVNSVTTFAKCHHGWCYYPTKVGRMHPQLKFDLLAEQYRACKEIDCNVPIYISAGLDNVASREHPHWREITSDGRYAGWQSSPIKAGFHKMCFNTPYLDYLCEQIEEVARLYPACDGIWLDIIHQGQCCCRWCMETMKQAGLDPSKESDRLACAQIVLKKYYERTTAAAKVTNADMAVFHNQGHIPKGRRDLLNYYSHLELESLPTGGWGYDHFPLSAKYVHKLPHDFLGMTGKFHTSWGEFGGFKHPNALRYECAAMLAFGAKCSIGDQLHPDARLDESTYELIGQAYTEVEQKEKFCDDVRNVAQIGLLSVEAVGDGQGRRTRNAHGDVGAVRVLLEEHMAFDVLDAEMDFSPYQLLILPDEIVVGGDLKRKLDTYLAGGGKLLLSGSSGLIDEQFIFDIGAAYHGESPYQPDFVLPAEDLRPQFVPHSPFVMYLKSSN